MTNDLIAVIYSDKSMRVFGPHWPEFIRVQVLEEAREELKDTNQNARPEKTARLVLIHPTVVRDITDDE